MRMESLETGPRLRPVRPPTPPAGRRSLPGVALEADDWVTRAFMLAGDALARYHRHRVVHLERLLRVLRRGRRVVLVANHALDIVDPLLFVLALYRRVGRVPRFIGHENGWFRVPILRAISARYGVIPSRRPEEARHALTRDGLLMLFPGSNTEALMRCYRDEPYRLRWENRSGFLRLALEADAEMVFVAALGNEELYYQSRLGTPGALVALVNAGDGERYRGAPLTFGLLGPHLLPGIFPWPVRLTHVVSPPLLLGDRAAALRDPEVFAALHRRVWSECQHFLDQVVARRERYADLADRTVRAGATWLQRLGA